MSKLSTYSKVGLVFVLVVIATVFGAIGGATYVSQLPATNSGVGTQAIGQPLWLVTMNDTTANRAFNTTYRNLENNGGQAMIVNVMVEFMCNGTNSEAGAFAETNQSISGLAARTVAEVGCIANPLGGNITETTELSFYVPWRFYYRVNATFTSGGAIIAIFQWLESIPPTGFGFIIQALPLLRRYF